MKINIPIEELHELIKSCNKKLWIFGETVCDLYFTNSSPLYYQLATNLNHSEIINLLKLEKKLDKSLTTNIFELYYNNKAFHYISNDFISDSLEYICYIELHCINNDFFHNLEKKSISIDQLIWDFKKIYNLNKVEKEFKEKNLKIYNLENTLTSNKLLTLSKYARYVSKYDLKNTTPIYPNNNFSSTELFNTTYWRNEWIKILLLKKPSLTFETLRQWKILNHTFNELLEGYKVEQNKHHKYDVYYHILASCDAVSENNLLIRLSALFHDIGKPRAKKEIIKNKSSKNVFYNHENIGARMTNYILKRFGFSKKTVNKVTTLVRLHMFHYTSEWSDSAIRRFLKKTNGHLKHLFTLRIADRVGSGKRKGLSPIIKNLEKRIQKINFEDKRLKIKDLSINGYDLMKHYSLKPGPIIGKILNYLLECVISDSSKNENKTLLCLTKKWIIANKNK